MLRRPPAARGDRGLDRLRDARIDLALKCSAVQPELETPRQRQVIRVGGEQVTCQEDGLVDSDAEVLIEVPNQRDVVDPVRRDPSSDAAVRGFDAWEVGGGQEVIGPFGLGSGRNSRDINMIVPRHKYSEKSVSL